MEVELIKGKTSQEESMEALRNGGGTIIPRVNLASCLMSDDKKDTANIALGGDNHIWFTFGKGKRPVKFHLGKVLMEAYRLAQEE
jgi:hypothetical protein